MVHVRVHGQMGVVDHQKLDVLSQCDLLAHALEEAKKLLVRIVVMPARMTNQGGGGQVREENLVYGNVNEYVYEEETGQPKAGGDA